MVQPRFAFLSRFLVKFLEVAGAGLASAVCAYALGQSGALNASPPAVVPAAQVSSANQVSSVSQASSANQVSPANEGTIPTTQNDHALVEPARKDAETPKNPDSATVMPATAPTPKAAATSTTAAVPKLAKATHAVQPRRTHKQDLTPVVEAKPRFVEPRSAEPAPIQAPVAATDSTPKTDATPKTAGQSADTGPGRDGSGSPTVNSGAEDRSLFARLKLVPPWFSPGSDRPNDKPNDRPLADVPRPPMPIGELPRSTM